MEHTQPKIGILTHFNSFQAGYALAVGWLERALLLEYFGQDFDFLVNETCPEGLYPHQRSCLPRIGEDCPFHDRAMFFRKAYRKLLKDYDVIMTADLIYQRKGNFLAWNQAMRWANEDFRVQGRKKRWLHWIHSAFTNREKASYPESLRFSPMKDSTLVYMNKSEKGGVAQMYGVDPGDVACVYNPKDPRSFGGFHRDAWEVTKLLDIPNKDVVQVFPHCTTRADAKGLNVVIDVFAALKRQGARVALVLANANAKAYGFQIKVKRDRAERLGLEYGKDLLFTSDITKDCSPLCREAVANLFSISNVFVFGSRREVCPNVLLEAKISGNLLVVNENLAPGIEFAGPKAITFPCTTKIPGVPDGKGDSKRVLLGPSSYDALAREIIVKVDLRRNLWEFSFDRVWNEQLKPLIYEEG